MRSLSHTLEIAAVATDGTRFAVRRSTKGSASALAAQVNDRFGRWFRARAANDHHTMAALDPFAQCYAQGTLEATDPHGPRMNLVPASAKLALFAAVMSIGLLPAVYALIVSE